MFSGKPAGIGLLIFTLVSAGAVQAASPTPTQSEDARGRAWMQELFAYASGYVGLAQEQRALEKDVSARVATALDAQSADATEAKAWAHAQRVRLAALDQKALAIQGRPFPATPSFKPSPNMQAMAVAYAKTPAIVDAEFHKTSALMQSAIDQIVLVASGDAAARQVLRRQEVELHIGEIESENVLVEMSNPRLADRDAQWDLASCNVEANLAALDVLHLILRESTGQAGGNHAAVAESVRAHARRMTPLADAMDSDARTEIAALPRSGDARDTRRREAYDTLFQSAANEREIAKGLEQVAARLDNPATSAREAYHDFDVVSPLLKRRLALVEQRRQLSAP